MLRSEKNPWLLVAVLCAVAGISNIDIFGIGYVAPFIETGLKLDNAEVGLLLSGFWLTFAISSYVTGAVTDRRHGHKGLLVIMLVLFAAGSMLPALAATFAALLAARLLMGVFDAAVYQIPQSIVVLQTPVERHGLNMGIVQNLGGALFGVVLAPLVLVGLAQAYGWRSTFLVLALPGVLCAALVARYVPRVRARAGWGREGDAAPSLGRSRLVGILRIRNVWVSAVSSCFIVAYMTVTLGFLPLFLVKTRHLDASRMSIIISIMGVSGAVLGVALPAASDRIGRKPIMIGSSFLGIGLPLAAQYYSGPMAGFGALAFVGSAILGAAPLTYATIPCESAPVGATSTVIGFILAVGTVVGGMVGPAIAGWSADRWGLAAPLYEALGCCAIVGMICLALTESAPRKKAFEVGVRVPSEPPTAS